MLVGSPMRWFLDKNNNLRRENAANHPSMIPQGAVSPTGEYIPYSYVLELREENARLISQHKELIESKNLQALALENEVLAAIIDGHLFKERIYEIVRLVIYQELDEFLQLRFSKGAVYRDEAIAEVRAKLATLNNSPEQNHGQ
tara:strand:+ start:574 stop:1005 length:432 start_codon:yes stop_codon:yes gene_type:complete